MSPGKLLRPMAGPCAYSLSSTPLEKPMPDLIDDLLRRMSLVEKVGQLNLANPDTDSTGAAIAATDIENRIRSIALRKDHLLLWMRGNDTALGRCF